MHERRSRGLSEGFLGDRAGRAGVEGRQVLVVGSELFGKWDRQPVGFLDGRRFVLAQTLGVKYMGLNPLNLFIKAEEENDSTKKERLDKLASFQLSMIKVSLSAFIPFSNEILTVFRRIYLQHAMKCKSPFDLAPAQS